MHNNHDVVETVVRRRICIRHRVPGYVLLAAVLLASALPPAGAAEEESGRERRRQPAAAESEMEARRLLVRAHELLDALETERGVRMLESIAEQYPASRVRFEAWLALGKHYLDARDQAKAVHYLGQLRALDADGETLAGDDLERYLESLYLTGVAHFQVRQYGSAFTALRRITNLYPNTVWANQSYYYIGMCHFAQQNWSKAIEALNLVGTFASAEGPTADLVEAGRRFYAKVQDADLPVLTALGKKVQVQLAAQSGDREQIECIALAAGADVFIGSIQTSPGPFTAGDGILQVIGGDVIITRYADANDQGGATNVVRDARTRVVGTATLGFTLGDLESVTPAVFLDQPLFLLLQDLDLDLTPGADPAEVRLIARYKDAGDAPAEPTTTAGALQQFVQAGEVRWITRDEVRVKLAEVGTAPVIRTGKFGGSVMVQALSAEQPANLADAVLTCEKDDEVIAYYEDVLHIGGDTPRVVESKAVVAGEIDNRPRASQDVVNDPLIRGKKNIVEATAYLELARIFKSMGLMQGARERTKDGLERVDALIRSRDPISVPVRQQAFKLKWELHMAADDYEQAIAVCRLFNQMYPDSPFADSALLGIANIHMDNGREGEALKIFRQILLLRHSDAKAEAQFRIAELVEKQPVSGVTQSIPEYRLCAERYPESHFAGKALAKLVDYHIETRDFVQADILLQQIFQDYPDAAFLDGMLLKWVLVSFRANQFQKAHEKCNQLIFDYPESPFAERAKQIMPRIEARLGQADAGSATGDQ
jgi:tetratricopeptide (TPR) repeat protein